MEIEYCFLREIFGPILPVVPVDDLDAAIQFVNERLDFSIFLFTSVSNLFHSETTPWCFMFSLKTLKSNTKVVIIFSPLARYLVFDALHSFQQDPEWSSSRE
jgi:hypothetical protein